MRPNPLLLALACLLLAPVAAGQEVETLPIEEISPGDTGYGLSVFRGTTIERFDVEVIDVLPNALPGQPLVLIRLSQHGEDGYPIHESGVIGGMSGSPIYIGDRLVGALAYGWGFSKDPIAGVTPIANMLDDATRPDERFGARPPAIDPWAGSEVRPVAAPLVVSGLTPRLYEDVRRRFASMPFVPLLGGGGAGGDEDVELAPGSAIAVSLMEGDLDFTAIGTVTHITPDGQVLAFGHPFFQSGPVRWVMKTARIQTVIRSVQRSNKLGSAIRTTGTLVKDRQASVVGTLGEGPPMIPIEIEVKNRSTGAGRTYRCSVVDHPSLTPILVSIALSNFAVATEPADGRATVSARLRFSVEGLGEFEVSDRYASRFGSVPSSVLTAFSLLYANNLRPVAVRSIALSVELLHEDRTARLDEVVLPRRRFAAGETVRGTVGLRRFGVDGVEVVGFELALPADLSPGLHELVLSGGNDVVPEMAPPASPEEIGLWIRSWYRSDDLVARLPVGRLTVGRDGSRLEGLPPSVLATLLRPGRAGDVAPLVDEIRSASRTPWILSGSQSIQIEVVER